MLLARSCSASSRLITAHSASCPADIRGVSGTGFIPRFYRCNHMNVVTSQPTVCKPETRWRRLAESSYPAQSRHAPCKTISCSDTANGTRSLSVAIARSNPGSENGITTPHSSQTR